MSCHSLQSLSYISQSRMFFAHAEMSYIYAAFIAFLPCRNRMCCLLFSLHFLFLPLSIICYSFSKRSSSSRRGAPCTTARIRCPALGCKGISSRNWGITSCISIQSVHHWHSSCAQAAWQWHVASVAWQGVARQIGQVVHHFPPQECSLHAAFPSILDIALRLLL